MTNDFITITKALTTLNISFEDAILVLNSNGYNQNFKHQTLISEDAFKLLKNHYIPQGSKTTLFEPVRLNKLLREFNISLDTAIKFLNREGYYIEFRPTTKISEEIYQCLSKEFQNEKIKKIASKKIGAEKRFEKEVLKTQREKMVEEKRGNNDQKGLAVDPSFLSVTKVLEVGQHRLFKVQEQKDTITILLDNATQETYVYKKLEVSIGEEIIMFVKDIDPYGKFRFDYSIYNDFSIDKKFSFNLVKEIEKGFIICKGYYNSFVPPSFEPYFIDGEIELEVIKIDPEKNNLFYKNSNEVNSIEGQQNPLELFKLGKIYDFKVINTKTSISGNHIFLVEHLDYKTTVKAFDFQLEDLPESIPCIVTHVDSSKVNIAQDKYHLLQTVYRENKTYEFLIKSIEIDENTGDQYYSLTDDYGFYHRLFINEYIEDQFQKMEIGKKESFFVKRIDEKGFLYLYLNNSEHTGIFYSAEEIFNALGREDQVKELFFGLEEIIETRNFKNKPYSSLYKDYSQKENLWIFSYLAFLDQLVLISCAQKEWEKAIEYTEIYVDLEEWLLEGSAFLNDFSKEKRDNIIVKAEQQLERAKTKLEALHLVKTNKAEEFIIKIKESVEKTGYLRTRKLGIFKETLKIEPELLSNIEGVIVKVISLLLKEERLDKFDFNFFNNILEKKVSEEKYQLNFNLIRSKNNIFDEETTGRIKEIIQLIALQIYLYQETGQSKKAAIKSSTLLRYLSFLNIDEKVKKELLETAVFCITNSRPIEISVDEINRINKDWLPRKLEFEVADLPKEFNAELNYNYGGAVFQTKAGWALLSNQQFFPFKTRTQINLFSNANYFGGKLVIGGVDQPIKLAGLTDFKKFRVNWERYFSPISQIDSKNLNHENIPPVGSIIKVRAKNYHKTSNDLLFVEIIDSDYTGEGALHINYASRVKMDGFNGIINPNEIFNAEVIKVNDGKISFGLTKQIWEQCKIVKDGTIVNAKVVDISKGYNFLMTENGMPAGCLAEGYKKRLELNKSYKFKISQPDEDFHLMLTAEYISETDQHIDVKKVFRDLLEVSIMDVNLDLPDDSQNNFFYKLIYELVLVIENFIILEKEQGKKLELLYLAKFLTSIIKHHKSYYYDAQLEFLHNVRNFKTLQVGEDFIPESYVDSETINSFENLELINDYYKILELFNKGNITPELLELKSSSKGGEVTRLGNMVLAYNLLHEEFPDDVDILLKTKNLIYGHISNEKLNAANDLLDPLEDQKAHEEKNIEKEINLGMEGKLKEFKTSFIYHAGTHKPDLEKQSRVIMKVIAGFLNSDGGTLYFGVNDEGNVIGLEEDYIHFQNADKYERTIRKYIVDSFNKDINGAVDFKFKRSGEKNYLEITIPQYEEPVALHQDFFQRQGNETRILTGNDLSLFFKRKYKAFN